MAPNKEAVITNLSLQHAVSVFLFFFTTTATIFRATLNRVLQRKQFVYRALSKSQLFRFTFTYTGREINHNVVTVEYTQIVNTQYSIIVDAEFQQNPLKLLGNDKLLLHQLANFIDIKCCSVCSNCQMDSTFSKIFMGMILCCWY